MMYTPSITKAVKARLFEIFISILPALQSTATVIVWTLIVWGLIWGVAEFGGMR